MFPDGVKDKALASWGRGLVVSLIEVIGKFDGKIDLLETGQSN